MDMDEEEVSNDVSDLKKKSHLSVCLHYYLNPVQKSYKGKGMNNALLPKLFTTFTGF